jgi:hypothetical protein
VIVGAQSCGLSKVQPKFFEAPADVAIVGLFAACRPLFFPCQIRRRNCAAQRGSIRTG